MMTGCASQATFGDAIVEGEPTALPTPIVPNKPVYQVERGDIVYEQRYTGRVTPSLVMNLQFPLNGRVIEVLVEDGAQVVAGDVLARLDKSVLESQLLNAEEELNIAQSLLDSASNQVNIGQQRAQLNLDLAQLRLDRAIAQASNPPTEHDNFLIGVQTIERDLAQLEVDEFNAGVDPELRFDVTRAQQQVDDIKASIAKTDLTAPMDGYLTTFTIDPGDTVEAFTYVGSVADIANIEVTNALNLADLTELTEGMPVRIQEAGSPENVYTGVISQLPEPYGTGSDEQIHVEFDTQPSPDDLTLGDRVSFTVVIEERNDVLVVPSSAIRQFSGRNFVVIQNDSVQQRVDVKLGLEGDDRVEILEGLEENQTVIGP